jgi:adenylosuccinate synthase
VYGDKYLKKGIRMDDLLSPDTIEQKVAGILEWKNMTLRGYGSDDAGLDEILAWLDTYGKPIIPFITDTAQYLYESAQAGKKIMFEAQLGALRDIDYGIYPYTTSSQTLAAYATIGAGLPGAKLDRVIGVMKAFSSCVGEGPFVVEMFGEEASALREAGGEYGAATGRPRRVGAFDIPASRYGARIQGVDELALTKLDVLSYLDKIPVCVAYEVDGVITGDFPSGDRLARAKPVYEYLDGFKADISGCRKMSDMPKAALDYIRFIEKAVGFPISYVSVGPERDAYLIME